MRMPSNMTHNFARVPQANIPRSTFRTPWTNKFDFDAGYLVPFLVDEVLPGDTFNDKFNFFARLGTPLKPFIDNLWFDTFYFYVPNRLVWDNWERFNGAQDDPDDTTDYLIPQIVPPVGGWDWHSLVAFMAPAVCKKTGFALDSLHTRAYNLIWNEFFRDQNLQNSAKVDKGNGPDNPADYVLRRRGKRHDYFTSCLPWPQKGPSASLFFTGNAPVSGIGISGSVTVSGPASTVRETDGNVAYPNYTPAGNAYIKMDAPSGTTGRPEIYADLSQASAFTINEFRQVFQLQMLLEMDARGGTRYVEILRAHFGVISPDFRLQRPEYLGGSSTRINVSQIPQTNSSDNTTPQGNMAAYGTVSNENDGYTKSFVEHGVIICLLNVRADLTYQQGLRRMWSRRTRFDFFWPALAHLGEMAVLNKEIFLKGDPLWDELVFGYQENWADYRYLPSQIGGALLSDHPQSLDYWHLSQDLVDPVLNEQFIEDNPPVDRVIAVEDEPQFIIDIFGMLNRARPIPVYSVPGLITRL